MLPKRPPTAATAANRSQWVGAAALSIALHGGILAGVQGLVPELGRAPMPVVPVYLVAAADVSHTSDTPTPPATVSPASLAGSAVVVETVSPSTPNRYTVATTAKVVDAGATAVAVTPAPLGTTPVNIPPPTAPVGVARQSKPSFAQLTHPAPGAPVDDPRPTVGAAGTEHRDAIPLRGTNRPPRYPYNARQQGLEGRVVLRVDVDASGHPREVTVRTSSGHRSLDQAAAQSVRRWQFVPARRLGIAVAGVAEVPIRFRLEG